MHLILYCNSYITTAVRMPATRNRGLDSVTEGLSAFVTHVYRQGAEIPGY